MDFGSGLLKCLTFNWFSKGKSSALQHLLISQLISSTQMTSLNAELGDNKNN